MTLRVILYLASNPFSTVLYFAQDGSSAYYVRTHSLISILNPDVKSCESVVLVISPVTAWTASKASKILTSRVYLHSRGIGAKGAETSITMFPSLTVFEFPEAKRCVEIFSSNSSEDHSQPHFSASSNVSLILRPNF